MGIEAVLILDAGGHKSQSVANAVANLDSLLPAPLVRDAVSGQPKSGSCDTGSITLIGPIRMAAVFNQSGGRVSLIPEELEAGALDIFEEVVLFAGETVFGGIVFKERRAFGTLLWWYRLGTLQKFRNQAGRTDEGESAGELRSPAEPGPSRGALTDHHALRWCAMRNTVHRRDWILLFIDKIILRERQVVAYRESRFSFQRLIRKIDKAENNGDE
jgi:hypothetical protein